MLNFRVSKLHNTMVWGLEILGFTSLGHSARSAGFGSFRVYFIACSARSAHRVQGLEVLGFTSMTQGFKA